MNKVVNRKRKEYFDMGQRPLATCPMTEFCSVANTCKRNLELDVYEYSHVVFLQLKKENITEGGCHHYISIK